MPCKRVYEKSLTKWLSRHRSEEALANSNYIKRKVDTLLTQCLHRIRLRLITPEYQVDDFPSISSQASQPDPIARQCSEPSLFDNNLPELL